MNEPQLPNITDILFKEFNKDYTQNAHIQAGIDAFFRYSFGVIKWQHKIFGNSMMVVQNKPIV